MRENIFLVYNKKKNIPICLVSIYLIFTVILYTIGPFKWETSAKFYFLQFIYICSLIIGYFTGQHSSSKILFNWEIEDDQRLINKLFLPTCINFVVIILGIFRSYGFSSFSIATLFSKLKYGITDMGQGYENHLQLLDSMNSYELIGGKIFVYLNLLWEFFGFLVLILDIYYIKKLRLPTKVMAILSILATIIYYLSIGTNIGVFRVVISSLVIYLINKVRKSSFEQVYSRKDKRGSLFLIIVAITLVILLFVKTMEARAGGNYIWNLNTYNVGGVYLDENSVFFKILPNSLYMPLIMISSYLTQGYYGLELATKVEWIPMFGLGKSMGIVDLFTNNGFNLERMTLQYRIEQQFGWDSRVQWASAYTWIANDVSLWGVPIILFFIGYFFSLTYRDAITSKNPYACVLMCYFAIMMLFLPCNNQIVQTTYTYFSFLVTFFFWYTSTRKKIVF